MCAESSTARQQAKRSSALCIYKECVFGIHLCNHLVYYLCKGLCTSNGFPECGSDVVVRWTNYCVVYCEFVLDLCRWTISVNLSSGQICLDISQYYVSSPRVNSLLTVLTLCWPDCRGVGCIRPNKRLNYIRLV